MISNRQALSALALVLAACRPGDGLPAGYQGVIEYEQRSVSFEAAGRVDRVAVARGDVLKDGDLVGKLDDSLERLVRDSRKDELGVIRADLALLEAGTRREEVAAVAAELNAAEASESLALKSATRARTLFASTAIPKAELEKAESDLSRATFQKKSLEERLSALRHGARPEELARAKARASEAESALALEEERLTRSELRVKGAGEVVDVHVRPGELAAVGTPAVTVADTQHPFADVFVPEAELDGIKVAAKVAVRVDATSEPFAGVVEHVSSQTEFTPRFLFSQQERPHLVIRVRVRLEDPARRLHAGVPAFAQIVR